MSVKKKFESIDLNKLPKDIREMLEGIKKRTNNFESDSSRSYEGALDKIIATLKKEHPEAVKTMKSVSEKKLNKAPVSEAFKNIRKIVKSDPMLKGFKGDILRDAQRTAKPFGKRVTAHGSVYYENRENRGDRFAPNYSGKPLLADGGLIDSVSDAIFFGNSNKDRIETSLGEKTLFGIKEMLTDLAFTPIEIANAIFTKNEINGKVSTGFGDKTLFGLEKMIENARMEFGGETELINDSVVHFKNYYLADGGETKMVDDYLKKQNLNRIQQELSDRPLAEVNLQEHKRYFPRFLKGYYFLVDGEEKTFNYWGIWDSVNNLFTGLDADPDYKNLSPYNNEFKVVEEITELQNKGEIKPQDIYNVPHVRYQAMEFGGETQLINNSVVDFKNYYLTNTGLTPSRFAEGGATNVRKKVEAKLIRGGNNPDDVKKMMNLHFDNGSRLYNDVNHIAEYIRTVY